MTTEEQTHSRLRNVEEAVIRHSERIKHVEKSVRKIEEKKVANRRMVFGGLIGFASSAAIIIFEYFFRGKG